MDILKQKTIKNCLIQLDIALNKQGYELGMEVKEGKVGLIIKKKEDE
jgi:hypothetical protein